MLSESSPQAILPVGTDLEAVADVDPGARAEALSWAPNTRKACVAGWKDFTGWCIDDRRPGMPASPADVGRYLELTVEKGRKSLTTVRLRLSKHPGPVSDSIVKGMLERLARGYDNPRK